MSRLASWWMNHVSLRASPGGETAFLAPLEQALGVGEGPLFFDVRGGGHEEDFRGDVLGLHLAALDLGRGVPEARGFDFHEVAHDQPLDPGQRLTLEPGVLAADRRVLAHDEVTLHAVVGHLHDEREMGMVAGELGQPVVAEVVFFRRALAVVRLEQADHVLGRVVPETGFLGVFFQVAREVVLLAVGGGHGQVAGQRVVKGRDIGRTLDGSMATQGHDAATGAAHVAQEKLQDTRGADDLHALGLVGPADRVAEGGGALGGGVSGESLGDLVKEFGRDAAHLFDHLGGVARVVTAKGLEDATRVFERLVAQGFGGVVARLELPGVELVMLAFLLPAREETRAVLSVAEVGAQDIGGVGVMDDVLAEILVCFDGVADEAAQKRDVTTGADGHPEIGHGAGARETRIDVDDRRAPFLGLHHPAEADRMRLGHGAALHDDAIGVRQIPAGPS